MTDREFIEKRNNEAYRAVLTLDYDEAIEFAKEVWALRGTKNKVIFIGNGASNTIANHAAMDYMSQTGVQTICVNDAATITAFANDFGYDNLFERFMRINYKEGDILVSVSSSGNSPNIINATKYVEDTGGKTYAFTGFSKDNKLSKITKNNFWVDSDKYNVVESIHNLWLVMVCDLMIEWMGDDVGEHGINV